MCLGLQNRSYIVQKGDSLKLACQLTNGGLVPSCNSPKGAAIGEAMESPNGEPSSGCHVTEDLANSTADSGTGTAGGLSLRWSSEADVFTKAKFVSIPQ